MAIYDPTKIIGDVYDTHTHLNDDSMFHDVPAYIGRAHEFHVMEMNVVGYDSIGNQRALEIAQAHQADGVHAIIGFQPDDAGQLTDEAYETLRQQLQEDVVVGIGETGLDYYHEGFDKEAQIASFEKHIALAKEFNLPITIHSREANEDVYQMLKQANVSNFVMHSYAGDEHDVENFLSLGGMISFSGMVTFKNAKAIKAAAKLVPDAQLLTETDAPYLAPTPYRGKMNEPAFTRYAVDGLAETLGRDREEIAQITRDNAHRVWLSK